MTDLETSKGCDAHKAITSCIRTIKAKQTERDHEMQRVYDKIDESHEKCIAEIGTRVSMKVFMWLVGFIIGFMMLNAGLNLTIARDQEGAREKLSGVAANQVEIKEMVKTLFRITNKPADPPGR